MLVLKIKDMYDDWPTERGMRSWFMWLAAKELAKFHGFSKKIKYLDLTIFIYYMIFQHQVKTKAYNGILCSIWFTH